MRELEAIALAAGGADNARGKSRPRCVVYADAAIGHKGADAIAQGNTLESFEAAVEAGVDMIELDVLRPRRTSPTRRLATGARRSVAAGAWPAARRPRLRRRRGAAAADPRRGPRRLPEPPLDQVEIDCDLKLPAARPSSPAPSPGTAWSSGRWSRRWRSRACASSPARARAAPAAGPTRRQARLDPMPLGGAAGRSPGSASLRRRFPARSRAAGAASWAWPSGPTTRWSRRGWSRPPSEAGVELIAWTVDEPTAWRADEWASTASAPTTRGSSRELSP